MAAEADIPEPIPLLRKEEEIKYMASNLLELAKTELKPHAGDPSIPSEQNGCSTEGTRNTQTATNITDFLKPVSEGHLQISDSTNYLASESGTMENPGEEACCKTLEASEIPQILAEKETLENDGAIRVNKATGLEDSEAIKRKEEEERSGKNHTILVPQETSSDEHQTESGKGKNEPRIIVGEGINKDCENPVKTLANEENNEVIEDALTSSNNMSRNEEHEVLAGASSAGVEASSRQMVDILDEPKVVTQIQSVNVPEDGLNKEIKMDKKTEQVDRGVVEIVDHPDDPKVVTEIQSDNVLQESPKDKAETDKFDDTAADVSQEADEKLEKIGASDKKVQEEGLGAAVAEADISDGVISQAIYVTECEKEIDHSLGDSIQETEERGIEKHAQPLTSNIPEVAYSAVSCEKAERKAYLEQTNINEEKFEEGEGDTPHHHATVGEDSRPKEKNQPPSKIIEETKDLEVSITAPDSNELDVNCSSTEKEQHEKREKQNGYTNSETEEPVNGASYLAEERDFQAYESRNSEHTLTDTEPAADFELGTSYERDKGFQGIHDSNTEKEENSPEEKIGIGTEGDVIEKGKITTEKLLVDAERSATCVEEELERHVQVESLLTKPMLEGENQSYFFQDNDTSKSAEVQECIDTKQIPEDTEEQIQGDDSAQQHLPSESTDELVEGSKVETDNVSTSEGKGKGDLIKDEVDREISSETAVDIPCCSIGYDKTTADSILDSQDTHLEMKRKDELSEEALASTENTVTNLEAEADNKRNENLDGESKNQTVDTLDISLEQKQQVSPDGEVSSFKEAEAEVDHACHTRCIEDEQGRILEDGDEASKLVDDVKEAVMMTEAQSVDLKIYSETTNVTDGNKEEQHVPVDVSTRHEPEHEGEVKPAEAYTGAVEDTMQHNTEPIATQDKNLSHIFPEEKAEAEMAENPDEAEANRDCQSNNVHQENPKRDNNESENKERAAQLNRTRTDECRGSELKKSGSCLEREVIESMDEKLEIPSEAKREDKEWAVKTVGADSSDKEIYQSTIETERTKIGELTDDGITGKGFQQPSATGDEKLAKALANEVSEDNHPGASSEYAEANSKLKGQGRQEEQIQETGEEMLLQPDANSAIRIAEEKHKQPAEIYWITRDLEGETVNKNASGLDNSSLTEENLDENDCEKQETTSKAEIEETIDKAREASIGKGKHDEVALESNRTTENKVTENASTDERLTSDLLVYETSSEKNEAVEDIKDVILKVETSGADTYGTEEEVHTNSIVTKTIQLVESRSYQSEDADQRHSTEVQDNAEIICSDGTVQGHVMQLTAAHSSAESVKEDLAEGFRNDLNHAYASSKEGSGALVKADPENDTSAELVGEFPLQGFQNIERPETTTVETVPYETYRISESPKALQSDSQEKSAEESRELESEEDLKEMVEEHELQEKLELTLPVTPEENKTIRSSNNGIEEENIRNQEENEHNEEKLGGRSVDCIADIASEKEDLIVQSLQTPVICKRRDSTTTETETKAIVEMLTDGDSFISKEKSEEEIIKEEIKEVYRSPEIDSALEESVREDLSEGFKETKLEQAERSKACEDNDKHCLDDRSIEEPETKVDKTVEEGNIIAGTSQITRTTYEDIEEVRQVDDCRETETCKADDQENHETTDLMEGLHQKSEKYHKEVRETSTTELYGNTLAEDKTSTSEEHQHEVDEEREKIEHTQETRQISKSMGTETHPVPQTQEGALIQEEKFSKSFPNDYKEGQVQMETQMREDFFTSDQVLGIQQATEQNSNEINQAAILCEEEPEVVNESSNGTKAELIMEKGSSRQEALLSSVSDLQVDEEEAGDLVIEEAEEKTGENKEKLVSTYNTEYDELRGAEEKNSIQESNNCTETASMTMVDEPVETSSININLDDKINCSQANRLEEEIPSYQTTQFQIKDLEQEQNLTVTPEQEGTSTIREDADKHVSNEDKPTEESERRLEQNSEEGNAAGVTSRQGMTLASDEGQEIEVPNKEDATTSDKEICEDDEDNLKIAHSTEGLIQKPEIEDVKEPAETPATDLPEDEIEEDITNTLDQMHESGEVMEKFDQNQETIQCPKEDTETPASTQAIEGIMIPEDENPTNLGVVLEQEQTEVKKEMHRYSYDSRQMPEVGETTKQKGNEFNKAAILSEEEEKGAEKRSSGEDSEEHTREERSILEHIASETDMSVNEVETGLVAKESDYSLITKEVNEKTDEDKENHAVTYTLSEELKNAQENIIQESHDCDMMVTETTVEVPVETSSSNKKVDDKIDANEKMLEEITEASDEAQESEVQDFSIDKQFSTPSFEQLSEKVEDKIHEEEIMNDKGPKNPPDEKIGESIISSQNEGLPDLVVAPRGNEACPDLFIMAEKLEKQTQYTSCELPPKEQMSEMNENVEEETKETWKLVNEGLEDPSGGDRSGTVEACLGKDSIQDHEAAMEDESASRPIHPVEKVEEQLPNSTALFSTEILEDECSEDKTSEISEKIEEKTKETQELFNEGPEDVSGAVRIRTTESCLEMDRIQEQETSLEDESASKPTHQPQKVENIPSLTSLSFAEILKDEFSADGEISVNIEEETKETQKLVNEGPEDASCADRSTRVEACSEEEGFQEHGAADGDESAPTPTHPAEKVEQNPSPSFLPSAEITKDEGVEDSLEYKTEENTFLQKEMHTDHVVALEHETHQLESPLDAAVAEEDETAKQSSGGAVPNTEAFAEDKTVVPWNLQLEKEGDHIASPSLPFLPTKVTKDEGAKDLEELKSEEQACLQREDLTDPIAASGNEIHNDIISSAEKEQKSETTVTVKKIEENAKEESPIKDSPNHASVADTSNDNTAISQNQQVQELGATRKDEPVTSENLHEQKAEEQDTLTASAFPSNDQKHDKTREDEMDAAIMLTKYYLASDTQETTCQENEALEYKTAAADESCSQVLPVVELLEKELLMTIENPVETKREEKEELDEERNQSFSIEKKIPEVPLQEDKDDISSAQNCSDDELEKKLQITQSEPTCEDMVHDKMTVSKDVEEWQVAEAVETGTSNERFTELQAVKIAAIEASTQPESEKQVQTPTLALPSNEDLHNRTAVEKVDKETKEVEFVEDKNQEPPAAAIETTGTLQLHEVLHELEAVKKDETAISTTSTTEEQMELPSLEIPLQSGETVHHTTTTIGAIEDFQEKDELEKPKIKFGEENVAPTIKSREWPSELECDSEVQIPEDHVAAKTESSFGENQRKEVSEQNEIAENKASNVEVREAFETSSPTSGSQGEMEEIYQEKLETSKTEVFVGTESTRDSNNTDLKIADDNKCIKIREIDSVALEETKADENEDLKSEAPQNEGSKGIAGGYERIHQEPVDASDVAFDRQNLGAVQSTEVRTTVIPADSEPLPLEETIKETDLTGTGNADNLFSGGSKPVVEDKDKTKNSEEETIVSTLMDSETTSLSDLLQKSTKEAEHIEQETVKGAKIEEENDEEQEGNEQQQHADSSSDAPVMVDVVNKDAKVSPKKSHNILSGVGSKVKHSISKVKKAITGKSSHAKPASPKGEKL